MTKAKKRSEPDEASAAENSTVREPGSRDSFIVGVGASAGGLEALESFFDSIPGDINAGFVVVQHLSPDFKSFMDQLLARHTTLKILAAKEGMDVRPGHIYLIPPRTDLRIVNKKLRLSSQTKDRTPPHPIDVFLHSLAVDSSEWGVAVILSGTGSDGSQGARAVKGAGGVVMVQEPGTAQFDGMPIAAMATGAADVIDAPAELGRRLAQYVESPSDSLAETPATGAGPFLDILAHLSREFGVEFAKYRENTIRRRLTRRMGILQINDLGEFRQLVTQNREEAEHLFQDLLIGVTEFFRDRDAFKRLDLALGDLIHKFGKTQLRVWIAACSTGEEAYSIAILLEESRQRTGLPNDYKIFATDLDGQALRRAGEGLFPFGIDSNVDAERLGRFFQRTSEGYKIARHIRDRIVFAAHNVLRDPPFTRIHLAACRNLLIYFKSDAQVQTLQAMHFSLVQGGYLMLGQSESLGTLGREFAEVDASARIFSKVRDVRLTTATGRVTLARSQLEKRGRAARTVSDYEQLVSSLVQELGAACLVLNDEGVIKHAFGNADTFLSIPHGRATFQLQQMINAEARTPISTGMLRARKGGEDVVYDRVRFRRDDAELDVRVVIKFLPAINASESGSYVLLLGESALSTPSNYDAVDADVDAHIQSLELDLQHTKENLQATIEELETTNEELQSTNEELVASNEELQSTNEELHSVNEELFTVNAEHQNKIAELTESTNDMANLLTSTGIGTIFLDRELVIRRYTPQAEDVIALVSSDVGRPIDHLAHKLDGIDLVGICRDVIADGEARETEASDLSGVPRLLRVYPYNAPDMEDGISGVVITFVDLSRVKEVQASLDEAQARFQQLVENLEQVFWILSPDAERVLYVSPRVERLWGQKPDAWYGNSDAWLDVVHEDDRERVRTTFAETIRTGQYDVEYRLMDPEGRERWIHSKAFAVTSDGEVKQIAGFAWDVTERKEQAARLEQLARELEAKAHTDALTGILNRRGLEVSLTRELERARRGAGTLTAMMIDVDDFKRINDSLGHSTGDVVLQGIATRIKGLVRPSDVLARLGGDEFLILLPDTRLPESLLVAERMRLSIVDHSLAVSNEPLVVSASFGVAVVPRDAVSIEEVLDATREALSASKQAGKNRVVASTDVSGRRLNSSLHRGEIQELLDGEAEIKAVAQTIREMGTGRVIACEMLSRAPGSVFGCPTDFFRASQERNALTLLDLRCLRVCLAAAATIPADLPVHVNLFPSTLVDTPIERLLPLFEACGPLDRFCVELSEQQFIGAPTYLVDSVEALKRAGVRIAVDDVGFGRSSLEALVVLEPHTIKIAREVVHGADSDPGMRHGLKRLTRAATALAEMVVAEGVESAGERDLLVSLGLTLGQGYLWDEPSDPGVLGGA